MLCPLWEIKAAKSFIGNLCLPVIKMSLLIYCFSPCRSSLNSRSILCLGACSSFVMLWGAKIYKCVYMYRTANKSKIHDKCDHKMHGQCGCSIKIVFSIVLGSLMYACIFPYSLPALLEKSLLGMKGGKNTCKRSLFTLGLRFLNVLNKWINYSASTATESPFWEHGLTDCYQPELLQAIHDSFPTQDRTITLT